MGPRLYLDFETRSVLDVKEVGIYKYASHPSTEPICFAYAIGDGAVKLWRRGEELPKELFYHHSQNGLWAAHNAGFDRAIMNRLLLLKQEPYRWRLTNTIDTAAKCRAAGVPAKLADAAIFLNLPYQKMTTGKLLVKRLSKPKSVEPLVWNEDPRALEQMYEYCMRDVETLRALDKALPDLSPEEHKVWCLDQEINARGVSIDKEFCEKGQKVVEEYKAGLNMQLREVTAAQVNACSEVARLTKWAVGMGAVSLKTIGKKDLAEALDGELPAIVRSALTLRKNFAKTSASKLTTFLDCLDEDGRVRDQYIYHGAGTGRFSGKLGQLQNLPRFPKGVNIANVVAAVKTGLADEIFKIGLTPSEAVSACLRAALIAGEGMTFYGADYSAIEARVVAWLAGQRDIVERFAAGEDVYLYTASKIYGRTITDADTAERTIGKVAVLALGYQGGPTAFDNMAKNYGVTVPEDERPAIVRGFRDANRHIVQYWYDVERAALDAMDNPGLIAVAGPKETAVKFQRKGDWLRLKLPSGRKLSYARPGVVINTKFGRRTRQVVYTGKLAGKTGTFQIEMYGGKFVENITQAVSRDIMVNGMFNVEAEGFRTVAHTHDELISEKEKGADERAQLARFEAAMTKAPSWAAGLPLAAKGWFGPRYTKG